MALRFGLIPAGEMRGGGLAFARAISDAIGEEVLVHHTADYRGLIAAMENGLVQMAWIPPIPAARAVKAGTLVPVVVARRNGMTSYSTCLYARKASPFRQVSDLRELRAAWVDRESASGFIVIRAALRAAGVNTVFAFREETFQRSHAAVGRAVLDDRADVGATFFSLQTGSGDIARAGWREGGLEDQDVHLILQAGPIPSDVFAVHSSVGKMQVTALTTGLIDARPRAVFEAAKALVHADAFEKPTEAHLSMLRGLLSTLDVGGSIPPPSVR